MSPTWHQSMLRVKDPSASLSFYIGVLGLTLVDRYDFDEYKFSLFFLQCLPKGAYTLTPGSEEAHQYLWDSNDVSLELTHNWGTEKDDTQYHPGNKEKDGFGHIAFAVSDLEAACDFLESRGVCFQKKLSEGRMRTMAFALDPDGYWMEIIKEEGNPDPAMPDFLLSQTMLRVKDAKATVDFYTSKFAMTPVSIRHFDSFSLYFLATLPKDLAAQVPHDLTSNDARMFVKRELYPRAIPVLELTHNHGSEKDPGLQLYNGNEDGRKGFGHIGFLVEDLLPFCSELEQDGVTFSKRPTEGNMKGLAFAKDPNGYLVEIIQRGQSGAF